MGRNVEFRAKEGTKWTGCLSPLQAMRAALLVLGLLPSVLCESNVELLGLAWSMEFRDFICNMESMDKPPFPTLRSWHEPLDNRMRESFGLITSHCIFFNLSE